MTTLQHNPASIAPPARNLYSHGVETRGPGRQLFIAGQVGVRLDGSIPEAFDDQVRQMMDNIGAVLASAGMGFDDIVKITAYCRSAEEIIGYAGIRNGYFSDKPPATTAFVVGGLANPAWLIEADAIAFRAD